MRTPFTFHSLFHSYEDRIDPYHEYDRMPSHKGLHRPRFNVTEIEAAYLIDGEFPGVSDKSKITVEWLQNQVLIIHAFIDPSDTEKAKDPFQTEGLRSELPRPTGKCGALIC
jgi:HSP20 family molecular chaperone IbpA